MIFGIYHEAQKKSPRVVCGVEEKNREEHEKEDQGIPFRQRRRVYEPYSPTAMPRLLAQCYTHPVLKF